MTAILSKTGMDRAFPQGASVRLSLSWPVAPEGLSHAAHFAGVASIVAARIMCLAQDDQLMLSLSCWREEFDRTSSVPAASVSIPLIRCCLPELQVLLDETEGVCHFDAPGVAAISFTINRTDSSILEPGTLLYARTTVAEQIGLPVGTLERAILA